MAGQDKKLGQLVYTIQRLEPYIMGQKCETGKYEARDQKMLLHLMIPQTRQVYTLYIFYNAGCECCSEGSV